MEHQLAVIDGGGLRCTVCLHAWKRQPVHACPGVPWYEWENAPEQLKTKTQLREMGLRLKKDARPAGCLWYGKSSSWVWLYEVSQAEERPAASEKQLAAAEKARAKQKELRTCQRCGVEQRSRSDLERGLCDDCQLQDWLGYERSRAVKWAQKLMADLGKWVILDTETTGLDDEAEIIQAAVLEPETGASFQALVKPQGSIPAEATAIHGITDAMVSDALSWPEVHKVLAELLAGKLVVIYNASFDVTMLEQTSRRYGLEIEVRCVCAMEWYAIFYGEWSDYYHSFKWQPLPGGDHSALGDCRATFELIKRMAGGEA